MAGGSANPLCGWGNVAIGTKLKTGLHYWIYHPWQPETSCAAAYFFCIFFICSFGIVQMTSNSIATRTVKFSVCWCIISNTKCFLKVTQTSPVYHLFSPSSFPMPCTQIKLGGLMKTFLLSFVAILHFLFVTAHMSQLARLATEELLFIVGFCMDNVDRPLMLSFPSCEWKHFISSHLHHAPQMHFQMDCQFRCMHLFM